MLSKRTLFVLFATALVECHSYVNIVVDLSHWNTVNLRTAKSDGIVGVIHKASEGRSPDRTYQERRTAAEREGLLWGAYHFGTSRSSGTAQADYFLRTVGNYRNVLLALDVEPNGGNTMSPAQAKEFVERVHQVTGRYPFLYGPPSFLSSYTSGALSMCKLWVAHYTSQSNPTLPTGRTTWTFWQYTDGKDGGSPKTVRGIGACDRNRFNGDERELRRVWAS